MMDDWSKLLHTDRNVVLPCQSPFISDSIIAVIGDINQYDHGSQQEGSCEQAHEFL